MRELLANAALAAVTIALVGVFAAIATHQPDRDQTRSEVVARDSWVDNALIALGYVDTVPVDDPENPLTGVTVWDTERTHPGLNLYCPAGSYYAVLLDMAGNEVHRWTQRRQKGRRWQFVELLPGGDLLVIRSDLSLTRMSWDSQLLWRVPLRAHHDATLAPDGTIWVLARRDVIETVGGHEVPILGDQVVHLTGDGGIIETIDLWPMMIEWMSDAAIRRVKRMAGRPGLLDSIRNAGPGEIHLRYDTDADISHHNTIEVVDRDIPGVCRTGDLLMMARNLDRLFVLDPETGSIRWSWSGHGIERPHHPTLIDGDHILFFDNGSRRGWSRVVEIDPLSEEIVWQYTGSEGRPFFSHSRGANERLANGNTLIIVGNRGRVIEVTPDGDIVWEFYCPVLKTGPAAGNVERAAIYRMSRVTDAALLGEVGLLP
ncbi:MAG: arylsulfotransferase family protein [Thermoanaerobaculales bacterium]|nr:arylsulfotransferase family protein [Thermoanaerobaculales bacterium]